MIGSKEVWTDKNNIRDYPLVVNDGVFPTDAIIDAFVVIWSDSVVDPCITTLNVGPRLISVVFSDSISGVDLFAAIGESGSEQEVLITRASDINISGYVKFGKMTSTQKTSTRYPNGSVSLLKHCFVNLGSNVVSYATTQGLDKKIQGDLSIELSGDFETSAYATPVRLIGDETFLEISLKNPSRYVEICATPQTSCECILPPIKQINSVLPDDEGNITIEALDNIPEITTIPFGVTITALASSNAVCVQPNLPLIGGKLIGET